MQSIKNIYEKIYDFENLHKAWEESKERLKRSIASYRGILSHCDSYGLRQSLNQLFIRKE